MRATIAKALHKIADVIGGLELQADRVSEERAFDALKKLREYASETVESADKEAQRRNALGLLDQEAPVQWRSDYYMRQGYRVLPTDDDSEDHWRGGSPQHDEAVCPICKKRLLLFWDINCRDPRFRAESPDLFGELDRLPLYYCCRRPEPTVYQVLPKGRIRMIRPELCGSEESPFKDFPDEFAHKRLRLEPIPRDVENLLIVTNEFDFDWLDERERGRLSEFLEERIASEYDINLSQFGGMPRLLQGHREIMCPNTHCMTHQMGDPILRNKRHYQMKEIAVIDDDSGFEMETSCAQIAFHICWKCHTVHAEYHCD